MESLGKQIREARRKLNMSLSDAAQMTGVPEQTLAAWERDEAAPDRQQLEKLGDALRTVLFAPEDQEQEREAAEATEREKLKEFRGKDKGPGMGSVLSTLWPVLAVVFLVVAIGGLVWAKSDIAQLNERINSLTQVLEATEKNVANVQREVANEMEVIKAYVPLIKDVTFSDHAAENDHNGYTFSTATEGNAFNGVLMQLYYWDNNKLAADFSRTYATGKVKGEYTHELASGEYKLVLRANSNLADEYVTCMVHLVQGDSYGYEFTVKTLTGAEIDLWDFQFWYKGNTAKAEAIE